MLGNSGTLTEMLKGTLGGTLVESLMVEEMLEEMLSKLWMLRGLLTELGTSEKTLDGML